MYPAAIAGQLRARGHDVIAMTERTELRSLSDDDVFAVAQSEERAIVTENLADFSLIANREDQRARPHYGIVFVDPSSYRRGQKRTIGRLVTALGRLLDDHPAHSAESLRLWL